jgi:hypothetical protein
MLFSTNAHHRHSNLLRYAPENKSSPRITKGKWLLENKYLTTRFKNITWPNSQKKTPKRAMKSD